MEKHPEALSVNNVEGGSDLEGRAVEQTEADSEARKEPLKDPSEKSPEIEINETVDEVDRIDRDIFAAQRSVAETQTKLSKLREDMGMPSGGENAPAAEFQNERIKQLKERRDELSRQKENWIKRYGRENLPEGLAFEDEDGDQEARGGSPEKEEDKERDGKEKKEDLELRKKWLKKWEEDSVKNFENAMRGDWRTKDATNLDLTIELMRIRVPKSMDKEAEGFINGTVDTPPFSAVWIKWRTSSMLDRVLDRPNQIGKLEITFDDESQKLVEDGELKKEEKNMEKKEAEPEETKSAQ
ncbi:MAG: hypothetical protein P4M11_08075 [Candidatus Pacebacteria bacterium]|nr:hypothetical protein [Candidatus Paceibacterota bacterium]